MTEQLELVPSAPRLTDRQTRALTYLRSCGPDGCTGAELGHHLGTSPFYARSTGLEVLRALKRKGLARQRRGGVWVADGATEKPDATFGEFPEGF